MVSKTRFESFHNRRPQSNVSRRPHKSQASVADMLSVTATKTATTITTTHGGTDAADEQQQMTPPAATCFTTADRYGVVFTTLLENKMHSIKQQTAVDKRKHCKRDAVDAAGCTSRTTPTDKRRGFAKTLSSCVHRNSVPDVSAEYHRHHDNAAATATTTATHDTDGEVAIELGQIDVIVPEIGKRIVSPPTARTTSVNDRSVVQQGPTDSDNNVDNPQRLSYVIDVESDDGGRERAHGNKYISHKRRVLEARSISAQASPIFPRTHGAGRSDSCDHHTQSMRRRAPVSNQTSNVYYVDQLVQPAMGQSLEAVEIRGRSVDSESSSHGFINNFNELTAHSLSSVASLNRPSTDAAEVDSDDNEQQMQPEPVSSMQQYRTGWMAQPHDHFSHHPSAEIWSPADGSGDMHDIGLGMAKPNDGRHHQHHHQHNHHTFDAREMGSSGSAVRHGRDWCDSMHSRRKYRHRGSDPVLIYPSSTGLPQCLLSIAPNRSIQIRYDDDTLYDVSMEVDRKQQKKDASKKSGMGRRRHRHRHHLHHHHDQHHRHTHNHSHQHHHGINQCRQKASDPDGRKHTSRRKKQILVHDMDTNKIKVVDSDDLPQRARWTIIATACLLLIMCLLLVGVTLRMAPLIDDMVRQENERLQQESQNRARFVRNLTDAASAAAELLRNVP